MNKLYYLCVVVIIILIFYDQRFAIAIPFFALSLVARGVRGGAPKTLIEYAQQNAGMFRFSDKESRGETVARAAIYAISGSLMGTPALLRPARGDPFRYRHIDLELDGYDEKRRLAFEYNGPQHYSFDGYCQMNRIRNPGSYDVLEFYRKRFYDLYKKKICRSKNVDILDIHYYNDLNEIETAVYTQLVELTKTGRITPVKEKIDDGDIIESFTQIDTRHYTNYPKITVGDASIILMSRHWSPQPLKGGMYGQMFDRELNAAIEHVRGEMHRRYRREWNARDYALFVFREIEQSVNEVRHEISDNMYALILNSVYRMTLDFSNQQQVAA